MATNLYGGPGGAIRTGLERAMGNYAVVFMGDGSDSAETILDMLRLAMSGDYDLVCASRYSSGGERVGGPTVARFLSCLAGTTLHWLGMPTGDATNAFKLYRSSLVRTARPGAKSFAVSLELLEAVLSRGGKVAELGTAWKDRVEGRSKFRFWGSLPEYARLYFRLGLRVANG